MDVSTVDFREGLIQPYVVLGRIEFSPSLGYSIEMLKCENMLSAGG